MKRLWIVGSGKRVVETALPVLAAGSSWELAGVASRKAKRLDSPLGELDVVALAELTAERLAGTDLLYLVVSKPAVPSVLAQLAPLVPATCDLLIETPVMLFKHFGHLDRLAAFRNTWVSEDCSTLPCWDPLFATGDVFRSATFERSAYAYHGIAMGRTILRAERVRSAKRTPGGREVHFANGSRIETVEPRDYARGRLSVEADGVLIADHDPGRPHQRLAVQADGERLLGFRLGERSTTLTPEEVACAGLPGTGDGMFRWMDAMKRIGFRRLLERLADGRSAYSLEHALEDAVVDYWLHRFGRYHATPLSDPRCAPARLSYRVLSKLVGRVR